MKRVSDVLPRWGPQGSGVATKPPLQASSVMLPQGPGGDAASVQTSPQLPTSLLTPTLL